jgi:hypothetical protein
MAECEWVILCERVVIEDQAKTVSLISIVENLNVPPPPRQLLKGGPGAALLPFRFYVVQQWARSNPKIGERVATRLLLIGPDGKQFALQEAVLDLTGAVRGRVISQVLGIPVSREGTYKCIVEAKVRTKWRKARLYEFALVFQREGGRRH